MEEVKDRFGESVSNQTVVDAVQRIMSPSTVVNEQGQTARDTDVPSQPSPKLRKPARSGLVELIDAGLLPSDAALECTLYGVSHAARVRDGQIELEGKTYATPSAAASALKEGKAANGWVIWRYKGELLADLRAKTNCQVRTA